MANEDFVPGENFMMLFSGLGNPEKPGMHGKEKAMGLPHESCCEFIATLRDMCDDFLREAGKNSSEKPGETEGDEVDSEDDTDKEEE